MVFILGVYFVYGLIVFPQEISQQLVGSLRISLYFLIGLGLFTLTVDFYVEKSKIKHLSFAIWILVGTILTIFLKGSLISITLEGFKNIQP